MPAPDSNTPALFTPQNSCGDSFLNPVWAIRILPVTALVTLLLAMFVFKAGTNGHDFCVGLATGVLIGASVAAFNIRSVEWKNNSRCPDVDEFQLTR